MTAVGFMPQVTFLFIALFAFVLFPVGVVSDNPRLRATADGGVEIDATELFVRDGDVVVSSLSGSNAGTAYACIDANGMLFRSSTPCVQVEGANIYNGTGCVSMINTERPQSWSATWTISGNLVHVQFTVDVELLSTSTTDPFKIACDSVAFKADVGEPKKGRASGVGFQFARPQYVGQATVYGSTVRFEGAATYAADVNVVREWNFFVTYAI